MPRAKKKEHERLEPANLRRVAQMLADGEVTKKRACEILNITYNTTRLNRLLSEQSEKDERLARRRKDNRGKPLSNAEVQRIVSDTLDGDSTKEISDSLARPASLIKKVLRDVGVPEKMSGDARFRTSLLPEQCVSDSFTVGEVAWSAMHHAPVLIREELSGNYEEKYGAKAYRVWINQEIKSKDDRPFFVQSASGGFNANLLAYDLGKLTHLEKLGVKISA